MIDPEKDLNAIQALFMADEVILTNLGLSLSSTPVEKAKAIIKRSQFNDLANNQSRLCIYFRPSRMARNPLFTDEVLQIDCHVPVLSDYKANRVLKRVRELLHNKDINGRTLYFYGQLGELLTASGYYCAGSRYHFYAVI